MACRLLGSNSVTPVICCDPCIHRGVDTYAFERHNVPCMSCRAERQRVNHKPLEACTFVPHIDDAGREGGQDYAVSNARGNQARPVGNSQNVEYQETDFVKGKNADAGGCDSLLVLQVPGVFAVPCLTCLPGSRRIMMPVGFDFVPYTAREGRNLLHKSITACCGESGVGSRRIRQLR